MSCVGDNCGIPAWGGPKPGDPSNNGVLQAKPAIGGIELSWTMPTENPFAVAHTKVYRSITEHFLNAVQIATWNGDQFFDRVAPNIQFWYWIQFVSINGTENAFIGPASAYAMDSIEELLTELTGRIDSGLLAQELRTNISNIATNANAIYAEAQARLADHNALQLTVAGVQDDINDALAFMLQETTARIDADGSLVNQINLIAATMGDSASAIQEEREVRASGDAALASAITTVNSVVNGNSATGQIGLTAKVDNVTGAMDSMFFAKVQANDLIGGFGIWNNGREVQAGFDVDQFWIGRTGPDKIKPFIIDDGVVYMDEAAIKSLVINKLRTEDGSVAFSNGKFRADLIDTSGINVTATDINTDNVTPSGRVKITNKGMAIYDANGQLRGFFGDDT